MIPKSELLYLFSLNALMMTIYVVVWFPVDTVSFDGYIGLVIIIYYMTCVTAVEPVKDKLEVIYKSRVCHPHTI